MTIRVWSAYSCNNSSSYRLVARFTEAETAAQVAAELEQFFRVHAAEVDGRDDYEEAPSEAQRALAAKYGFAFDEVMYWGDGGLVGDEPDLILDNEVLIVHHGYCGGGLGTGVPAYLAARGARVDPESGGSDIWVAMLFRAAPGADPKLDAGLNDMFAQLHDDAQEDKCGGQFVPKFSGPWGGEHETYGNVALFRDSGTVGLAFPLDPRDLPAVRSWLVRHRITQVSLELGESGIVRAFAAIAKARCRSCEGRLDYLDPRLHDIESPQFVCKPCGGLYELAVFLPQ